jgi:two-component system response regulator MprA
MKVLIVEDDAAVGRALERVLRAHGYLTAHATDGRSGLAEATRNGFDAMLLDVNLPDISGIDVCRQLRGTGSRLPVLMLTARDTVTDRVAGLDAGADDYLVKPFALPELVARVRALLRRSGSDETAGGDDTLSFEDVTLDMRAYEARRGARSLGLTRTEFLLLELFMRNPRQVLTREVILDRVWGFDAAGSSNGVEVYIGYLRRKLEADGERRIVHTVRGFGYALREP